MPRTRTTLAARTGALLTVLAALLSGSLPAPAAGVVDRAPGAASSDGVRNAVFVGNNWDGTADVLAPGSFERLGRVDVVPDQDERMAEIAANPVRLAFFLAIRQEIGEGHDQSSTTSTPPPTADADRLPTRPSRTSSRSASRPGRSCGASRLRATAPTTWRCRRTAGASSSAPPPRTSCTCCASATARRWASFPSGGSPARERLHRRRAADPARQHRHGLQPRRPAGARRDQGRAGARDRRRPHLRGAAQVRPAQGPRRPRAWTGSAPPSGR